MYFDSNIFIFAALNKGELGRDCRALLSLLESKQISGAASYLVADEVVWVLQRKKGKTEAVELAKALLSLPLRWAEVNQTVIIRTLEAYEKTKLDPRDALHLASMRELGLSSIVSEDKDFDGVAGLERLTAAQCLGKYG